MPVSNPLYKRLAGQHPDRDARGNQTRPKIPIEVFLAVLRSFAVGDITGQQASDRISEVSYYQDATGTPIPVGLDTTEQSQANDLRLTVGTGTTAQASADRANQLIKIRETLMVGEFSGLNLLVSPPAATASVTGYAPDDMAGTTSVAGGKLNVIRRDSP